MPWWWWGSGGPAPDPAAALLAEAAVWFDFSQYDDVNAMFDVNSGWGPVKDLTQPGAYSFQFVADGLEMTTNGISVNISRRIGTDQPVIGPLTFGPDGITLLDVVRLVDGVDGTVALGIQAAEIIQANSTGGGGTGYPQGEADWSVPYDTSPSFYDMEPSEDTIVDVYEELVPQPVYPAGVYLSIYALDVPGHELRIRLITPDADQSFSHAFDKPVPDYAADPQPIDKFRMRTTIAFEGDVGVVSLVQVGWLGWNRALTLAEVNALIAHFSA